jgi:glycosyltransferase involved in cell wall biosynthesis
VDDLTLEDLVDLELLDESSLVLWLAERVYKLFLLKADAVTPISSEYVKILVQKYCIEPSRIHTVRGGVDLSVFKPSMPKRESEKFVVLYSGAFSVAYDFEQIFKAAKIVEEVDGDVEFVVQGAGELLSSMLFSISKLNVKNVKIVNKILSRVDVAELLGRADVLILPLVEFNKPYRGLSSKLYEYQAVGKPIICCSRGLPKQYVEETRSGLVVYPGDYEALARAIIQLKETPSLAHLLGENGRKFVENEASIESIGLKMKEILQGRLQSTQGLSDE